MKILIQIEIVEKLHPVFISVVSSAVCLIPLYKLFN